MKLSGIILLAVVVITIPCRSQNKTVEGTFSNTVDERSITFYQDSTFEYISKLHPTFSRWENFDEKGRWSLSGDTIILNPQLRKKIFVAADMIEENILGTPGLQLTFNHIKQYIDANGVVVSSDTLQLQRVDYALNERRKRTLRRISPQRSGRCTFAGYIPPETITKSRTIVLPLPAEKVKRIFVGCYELQGFKSFELRNPGANRLTINIYSKYYLDGQLRQVRLLLRNGRTIFTRQKKNGAFITASHWTHNAEKLTRQTVNQN